MFMNTSDQYGLIARSLHWLIFLLVVAMLLGGVLLPHLPSGGFKSLAYSAHKSTGVVILLLMILRLIWRSCNPLPRNLANRPILNYAAHVLHICLYTLLFLQPLSGILMSQAYGYPVSVFGVFELPRFIWQSATLGQFFREVHGAAAAILASAIVVHVAAALKHHYIDGNRTLMRMIKGK